MTAKRTPSVSSNGRRKGILQSRYEMQNSSPDGRVSPEKSARLQKLHLSLGPCGKKRLRLRKVPWEVGKGRKKLESLGTGDSSAEAE